MKLCDLSIESDGDAQEKSDLNIDVEDTVRA